MSDTASDNRDTSSGKRPLWRRGLKWFGILVAILMVLLLIARILVATPIVRNLIETRIEATDINGARIELVGFTGDLLGRFGVEQLVVRDAEGEAITARDVSIKWSPLSLIGRGVTVDTLKAAEVNLIRRPVMEPGEPRESDETGGAFPLRRIELGELSIEAITISEDFAGRAASFAVSGGLLYERTGGDAVLNLTPITGSSDNIAVDLNWASDRLLNGSLDAQIEADGVFAKVAGLPEATGIELGFRGEGGITDWSANGTARLNGETALEFDGNRKTRLVSELRIMPEALAQLVPIVGKLREDVVLTLDVDTEPRRDLPAVITIESDLLTGQIDAVLPSFQSPTPERLAFDLSVSDPTRFLDGDTVDVARLGLRGDALRDRKGVLAGRATLDARGLRVQETARIEHLSGEIETALSDQSIDVEFDLKSMGFASSVEDAVALFGASPSLSGTAQLNRATSQVEIDGVRLSGAGTSLSGTGSVALDDGPRLDLVTTLDGRDLASSSRGYVETAAGDVRLRGTPSDLAIFTDLELTTGSAIPAQIAPALNGPVQLTSDIGLKGSAIDLRSLNLVGSGLRLDWTGQYSADGYAADIDLAIGPLDEQGLGRTVLSLKGQGRSDAISAQLSGRADTLTVGAYDVADLSLNGQVSGNPNGRIAGNIEVLSHAAAGAPFQLSTAIDYVADRQSLRNLSLDWGTLRGSGQVTRSGDGLDGLAGDIRLTGSPPVDAIPFDDVDVTLTANGQTLAADGALAGLTLAGFLFETATFNASGALSDLDFAVNLEGARDVLSIRRDAILNLAGTLQQESEGLTVSSALNGQLGELAFATNAPATVRLRDGDLSADVDLGLSDGSVQLTLEPTERGRVVVATLDGVKLGPVFDLLARPDLGGFAAGTAKIDLVSGQVPTGSASLRLDGLGLVERDRPDITLLVDAALSDQSAVITSDLSGIDGLTLDSIATLPTSDGGYDLNAMTVTADGSGPLETLWAFAGMPDTQLKGTFTLSSSASGMAGLDGVRADLSVDDAQFEHGAFGLFLDDIDLRAGFRNKIVAIDAFNAVGREGGTVDVSGQIGIDGNGTVGIRLDELTAVRRKGLSAIASGAIDYVAGEGETNRVSGEITVNEARIDLAELNFGTRPPTIEVAFEEDENLEDETDPAAADPTPTELDIRIRAPRQIAVTGQGVNAELSLSADVVGTLAKPEYDARAEILRGDISLLGKEFEFIEGVVTIPGNIDDGRLDIQAERETVSLTAIAEVRGDILQPEITFSSNPSLPDDEILSRVLFGRSPSQLSALEAAQLASALASLAGGGGGFNPTAGLMEATGLDRLDVGTDATGSATVTTGKYLAEDVYLEVATTPSGAPGVVVEWTPLDNVEVETELDPIGGPKLSVDWTRDFD